MHESIPPKGERLKELFRRLNAEPPARSFDEAYDMVDRIMTQVEDELTGLPNDPSQWKTTERMFPPSKEYMRAVPGTEVVRFDHIHHITYVATNGAIEMRPKAIGRPPLFTKCGADGRLVTDVAPALEGQNL